MFAASKTAAAAAGTPPPSTDPQFNYVTMLLHGDGTNGAQNNTFVDSSTNNFTITRNGTPTQGSFSPYGDLWSNQFSATGQFLTLPASSTAWAWGTSSYTIELWVYPTELAVNRALIAHQQSTTNAWELYLTSAGGVNFRYWNGSQQLVSTAGSLVAANRWTHIAFVNNAGAITIYVNGVSSATNTVQSGWFSGNLTLKIGQAQFGTNPSDYLGYMSNVRLVNGTAVYTAAFTPSTTPLTAVSGTSLLTCQSNRFRDNSSNNFAITVTGTPSVQRFSPFDPAAEYSTSVIGGSGYFKGSTDFLTLVDNAIWDLPGDFTVECFVYMIGAQNDKNFIVQYPGGTGGLSFGTFNSGNRLQFGAAGVAYDVTSTNAIPVYQWVHVAAVRSGTSLKLYINGVNDGTATQSRTYGGSAPLAIGGNSGSAAQCFLGYISDARIVKGTAVYTAAFTPPTAPLTAITNTSLLLNTVNAGIFDNAMMNDLVTVGNAQVSTAVKKYGTGSMAFDGTNDYLPVASSQSANFGSGDFTVEYWTYPTSFSSGIGYIQHVGGATNTSTALSFGEQGGFPYATTSTTGQKATTSLSLNTWSYVAWTRSGTTLRCFINGTLITTFTNSVVVANPTVGVGATSAGLYKYAGYIDDLRITKGIARYTANFTPPTAAFPNN